MPTTSLVVFTLLVSLAAGAESQEAPAPAPAPAAGGHCYARLAKAADCIQYLTPGSPVSQPQDKCCTGVDSVFKDPAAVSCVCDLLAGHTSGLPLNLTRTAGLPVACGAAPAFSLGNCNATAPGGAPSKSAATQSPITAILVATLLISAGYNF